MIQENLDKIQSTLKKGVTLVAVSKTKPIELLQEAYDAGQRVFGENKIQEMQLKFESLPKDIEWHMIGHVQGNKIKHMAPFVSLVHGMDKVKRLKELNKEALKNDRIIDCLLQVHIAKEDTKFGFSQDELVELFESNGLAEFKNIKVKGLMGMATNTSDETLVRSEFSMLNSLYAKLKSEYDLDWDVLSMGMSGDYAIAMEEGSTMVRIGSSIFGMRN